MARAAQYRVIYHYRKVYTVNAMCAFFGVSRAAYYAGIKRLEQEDRDMEKMQMVQEAWERSRKTYGYRRITLWLAQKQGVVLNHKTVLRLMRKLGIRSNARKPRMYKKLEESALYHRAENVLNRDFTASKPNQKWVTDVTYILTQQGWAYLSAIKDLYDGFIVAHTFGQSNSVQLVVDMLKQAKQKEKVTDGLILHSDHIVPMSFGRGTNTLRRRIMMSLSLSITSPPLCLGVAIVGIMRLWKTSSDISKKSTCVMSKNHPLKKPANSSMNIFPFSTTKGYN